MRRILQASPIVALLFLAPRAGAAEADLGSEKERVLADFRAALTEGVGDAAAAALLDGVRSAIVERIGPDQRKAFDEAVRRGAPAADPGREALRIVEALLADVTLLDDQLRGILGAVDGAVAGARAPAAPAPLAPSPAAGDGDAPPAAEDPAASEPEPKRPAGIGVAQTFEEPKPPAEDAPPPPKPASHPGGGMKFDFSDFYKKEPDPAAGTTGSGSNPPKKKKRPARKPDDTTPPATGSKPNPAGPSSSPGPATSSASLVPVPKSPRTSPATPAPAAPPVPSPSPPAASTDGWRDIPFDAALTAFDKKKGDWKVENGVLIATGGATDPITYSLTTKEKFSDVEISCNVDFSGTGSCKLRLRYVPKKEVSDFLGARLKPTRGKTVLVTLRAAGPNAAVTIDGAAADPDISGTAPAEGPLNLFAGVKGGAVRFSNLKIRALPPGSVPPPPPPPVVQAPPPASPPASAPPKPPDPVPAPNALAPSAPPKEEPVPPAAKEAWDP